MHINDDARAGVSNPRSEHTRPAEEAFIGGGSTMTRGLAGALLPVQGWKSRHLTMYIHNLIDVTRVQKERC